MSLDCASFTELKDNQYCVPRLCAMRLAVPKGLNHLPDELIHEAIEVLQ